MDMTTVPTATLKSLLAWCEDAIDFQDESDEVAANAWDALMDEIEKRS